MLLCFRKMPPKIRYSSQRYRCLYCGIGFWEMSGLQEHVRDCKREQEKAVPERQKSDVGIQESRTNMCEYCSKLFGRMSDLRRHMRRTHTQITENTSAVSIAVPSTLPCDELGPDSDIEILAEDGDFSPTPIESVIKRKPTRPPPVVSGLKAPLVSLTGQSFDFGDKIVTNNVTTMPSKTVTVETTIVPERQVKLNR